MLTLTKCTQNIINNPYLIIIHQHAVYIINNNNHGDKNPAGQLIK